MPEKDSNPEESKDLGQESESLIMDDIEDSESESESEPSPEDFEDEFEEDLEEELEVLRSKPISMTKSAYLNEALRKARKEGVVLKSKVRRPPKPSWIQARKIAARDDWSHWRAWGANTSRFCELGLLANIDLNKYWKVQMLKDGLGTKHTWIWAKDIPMKRGHKKNDKQLDTYLEMLRYLLKESSECYTLPHFMNTERWYLIRYTGVRKVTKSIRRITALIIKWVRNIDLDKLRERAYNEIEVFYEKSLRRQIAFGKSEADVRKHLDEKVIPVVVKYIESQYRDAYGILDRVMPRVAFMNMPDWISFWGPVNPHDWVAHLPPQIFKKNVLPLSGYLSQCISVFTRAADYKSSGKKLGNGDVSIAGYSGILKTYEVLEALGIKNIDWLRELAAVPHTYSLHYVVEDYVNNPNGIGMWMYDKLLGILSHNNQYNREDEWQGKYLDLIQDIIDQLPEAVFETFKPPREAYPWGAKSMWLTSDNIGRPAIKSFAKKPKHTWKPGYAVDFEKELLKPDEEKDGSPRLMLEEILHEQSKGKTYEEAREEVQRYYKRKRSVRFKPLF